MFTVTTSYPTDGGRHEHESTDLSREQAMEQVVADSRGLATFGDAQNLVENTGTLRLTPPGRGVLSTPASECRMVTVTKAAA